MEKVAVLGPHCDLRDSIVSTFTTSPVGPPVIVNQAGQNLPENVSVVIHLPPPCLGTKESPVIWAAKLAAASPLPHLIVAVQYDYVLAHRAIRSGASLVVPSSAIGLLPYFAVQLAANRRVELQLPSLIEAQQCLRKLRAACKERLCEPEVAACAAG